MEVSAAVTVNAPVETVYGIIANIDNAATNISAIEDVKVLERPATGLVGLKWTETRTMFGKTATETMWITNSVENEFYETEARSHGCLYRSKMHVAGKDGGTELRMEFKGESQTFSAKLMFLLMGFMFKSGTQKALQQDLEDIKSAAEKLA